MEKLAIYLATINFAYTLLIILLYKWKTFFKFVKQRVSAIKVNLAWLKLPELDRFRNPFGYKPMPCAHCPQETRPSKMPWLNFRK